MLKSQVNQRVKDAWVIGTTVDRQQRDTLDSNEETVEASIKYMEASMPRKSSQIGSRVDSFTSMSYYRFIKDSQRQAIRSIMGGTRNRQLC